MGNCFQFCVNGNSKNFFIIKFEFLREFGTLASVSWHQTLTGPPPRVLLHIFTIRNIKMKIYSIGSYGARMHVCFSRYHENEEGNICQKNSVKESAKMSRVQERSTIKFRPTLAMIRLFGNRRSTCGHFTALSLLRFSFFFMTCNRIAKKRGEEKIPHLTKNKSSLLLCENTSLSLCKWTFYFF